MFPVGGGDVGGLEVGKSSFFEVREYVARRTLKKIVSVEGTLAELKSRFWLNGEHSQLLRNLQIPAS